MASSVKTWIGIFLVSFLTAVIGFNVITQMPAGLVPDDGYFYSKIAFNIANHGFSSFDGVNPTDGYHQLWQYLLAAVAWGAKPFTGSKSVILFLFVVTDLFFLTGAAWFGGKTWLGRIFLFSSLAGCEFLMEGHLYAFLIALGCGACLVKSDDEPIPLVSLVCFGLVPLARIDTSVIPLAIVGAFYLSGNRRKSLTILGAVFVGIVCHFGLMVGLHGHLLSVSSQLKADGPRGFSRLMTNIGQRTPTLPIPFEPQSIFALILCGLAANSVVKVGGYKVKPLLAGLWAGTTLFICAHLLLSEVHPWYFAPAYIGFPIVIIWSYRSEPIKLLIPCTGFSLLLVFGLLLKGFRNRSEVPFVKIFVTELNRTVSSNRRIYMVDGSGYLGYFADAPVINGDGLVNSHEYAAELQKNDLGNYLAENHIDLLITNKNLAPAQPLEDIGGLHVDRTDATPILVKADNGHYFFTNFVLWKIKPGLVVQKALSAR